MKFNFPMAYTTTMLAWGYLEWKDAYTAAGQNDELEAALRWSLDYFIKCHVAPHELYVQVTSNSSSQHMYGLSTSNTAKSSTISDSEIQEIHLLFMAFLNHTL